MSTEPGANDSSIPPPKPEEAANEHLNIKVTDGNNEVFFKIKRTTQLKKLMDAFCDRQGKSPTSVRFLFDGTRVQGNDSPHTVSIPYMTRFCLAFSLFLHAFLSHACILLFFHMRKIVGGGAMMYGLPII